MLSDFDNLAKQIKEEFSKFNEEGKRTPFLAERINKNAELEI